jgi:hypothetical protein
MPWKKCTEERYDEMLSILPPAIYLYHGFLVGEPASHRICTKSGGFRADFAAFVRIGDEFYEGPNLTLPEFRALDLEQIRKEAV